MSSSRSRRLRAAKTKRDLWTRATASNSQNFSPDDAHKQALDAYALEMLMSIFWMMMQIHNALFFGCANQTSDSNESIPNDHHADGIDEDETSKTRQEVQSMPLHALPANTSTLMTEHRIEQPAHSSSDDLMNTYCESRSPVDDSDVMSPSSDVDDLQQNEPDERVKKSQMESMTDRLIAESRIT